ncbi:hypothetical protein A8709_12945 [Paenibacillus pectinilyticus]|uniref:Uncharacterized protein n=1 Tax=Paenibacillus pectinilyticus TaxID=512399 RepID=A0A1C1A374_9BACL|nr:hypothetical protein A8709_12945 [Paenibacillus pectinilyticus]
MVMWPFVIALTIIIRTLFVVNEIMFVKLIGILLEFWSMQVSGNKVWKAMGFYKLSMIFILNRTSIWLLIMSRFHFT